jgi:glutamate synthase domain-containing protein 3
MFRRRHRVAEPDRVAAVILGRVGDNFGAGMSGGMAFVYDEAGDFPLFVNDGSVVHQRLESQYWESHLKRLIEEHAEETQSRFARRLLNDWMLERGKFWQIAPKEMLDKLSNSSARLIALGWMDAGTRNVYSDKPVTKPADLKGMKIRMMGNPLFVETMNAMGGNGIAMGFNELHQALQSGVVDGAENNEPTLFAQNHYQTPKGKVYSLTGHLIIPEIFVYSKVSWDKLPKGDQELIKKLSREAQLEQRKLWDAYVAEATGKLKAAGVKFVPADKEAFYKATQPVRDKYGAKYAGLIQRIRDTK